MPPVGKNPKMSRPGKENGRWKSGKSSDYQRRITNAGKSELVHHMDGNRMHNAKSNLKVLKPGESISAIGRHNKVHPEKGRKK